MVNMTGHGDEGILKHSFTTEANFKCDGHVKHRESLFLPILDEGPWRTEIRIGLYAVGLFNCFVGMAFAVDLFVKASDKITSKLIKFRSKDPATGAVTYKRVPLWNDTVATLTLGSVAVCSPEIMLHVIETLIHDFDAGMLGPGTIIGSAAFNLMVTIAVAISAPPTPLTRRVEQFDVYFVTTCFNIFAYLWIAIVMKGFSSEVIEIWEAGVTVALFPVLIICAYIADKVSVRPALCCGEGSGPSDSTRASVAFNAGEIGVAIISPLASQENLRNGGTVHQMVIGKTETRRISIRKSSKVSDSEMISSSSRTDSARPSKFAEIEFASSRHGIEKSDTSHFFTIVRTGRLDIEASVNIDLEDRTAKNQTLSKLLITFQPGEDRKIVSVDFPDKPHETLKLHSGRVLYATLHKPKQPYYDRIVLGEHHSAQIIVANEDETTKISFKDDKIYVKDGSKHANITIERSGHFKEESKATILTKDDSATSGEHYIQSMAEIVFAPRELEKTFRVPLVSRSDKLNKQIAFIAMLDAIEGARLGEKGSINVIMMPNDEHSHRLAEASNVVSRMLETKHKSWWEAWRDQFIKAVSVNNGDIVSANSMDYFLHCISFYWKLLFAFVPPAQIGGGYLTYLCALGVISMLSALMGDMAMIFGCLCGLDDVVVAVAFISVGTNMPDLFASRLAAIKESTADGAIGHIQGSICVNVFLGLGVPWLMASIYWEYQGKKFIVDVGELWWCVTIYLAACGISVSLLLLRARLECCGKAMLGGPRYTKWLCSFILVVSWITYVALTGLRSSGFISGF